MGVLFRRDARRVDPTLWYDGGSDQGSASGLSLRYLGTAGFVVEGGGHTLVLDPYLTRPGLLRTGVRHLRPDAELLRRFLPRADDVLVGHAHFDHILDAPELCRQTGARFIGGPTACHCARAAGVPEDQIRATRGREDIDCGPFTVRGLPAPHGKAVLGRVPLPGTLDAPPRWPPRFWRLPHGEVLNWHLQLGGLSVVHIDSADFIDDELRGLAADVVCLCAVGRQYRPDYLQTVVELLRPRFIVPCHWDWFFRPYTAAPVPLPGVDLAGFDREIRALGVTPVLLPFEGRFDLPV